MATLLHQSSTSREQRSLSCCHLQPSSVAEGLDPLSILDCFFFSLSHYFHSLFLLDSANIHRIHDLFSLCPSPPN